MFTFLYIKKKARRVKPPLVKIIEVFALCYCLVQQTYSTLTLVISYLLYKLAVFKVIFQREAL